MSRAGDLVTWSDGICICTGEYDDYITSAAWKLKRREVLERDEYKCVECGKTSKLQVHHKTYARLGDEKLSDLETLCPSCHELADEEREESTAYYRGLETWTRKVYGEHAYPYDHEVEFREWIGMRNDEW